MRKGIVVDEKKKYVIILTSNGEFVKVRKEHEHYLLGQEISSSIQPKTLKAFRSPALKVAIATMMILSIFLTYSFYQRPLDHAFAYVAIDINPSLNIEIDKQLRVLNIEAFNFDGERIKDLLPNWKNQDLEAVTRMILDCSKQQGFFINDREVLVSVAFLNEEVRAQNKNVAKNIKKQLNQLSQDREMSITTFEITKEMHELAKEKKTTPNKYAIVQSAHDAGIEITIKEINEKSIKQINQELSGISILKNGMKERPEQKRNHPQDSSSINPSEEKEEKPLNKKQEKSHPKADILNKKQHEHNEQQKKVQEEQNKNFNKQKQDNKKPQNRANEKEMKKGKPEQKNPSNGKPNKSVSNGSENKKSDEANGNRDRGM